jgi:hypothetical protein
MEDATHDARPTDRERLRRVIAKSVEVTVAVHDDGSYTTRGLDDATANKITDAVLAAGWWTPKAT